MKLHKLFLTIFVFFSIGMVDSYAIPYKTLQKVIEDILTYNKLPYTIHLEINSFKANGSVKMRFCAENKHLELYIDPEKLAMEDANTWAHIISHEIAHRSLMRGGTLKDEAHIDLLACKYAKTAHFSNQEYLDTLINEEDFCSDIYGCWYERAIVITRANKLNPHELQQMVHQEHHKHMQSLAAFPSFHRLADEHREKQPKNFTRQALSHRHHRYR